MTISEHIRANIESQARIVWLCWIAHCRLNNCPVNDELTTERIHLLTEMLIGEYLSPGSSTGECAPFIQAIAAAMK